VRTVFLPIALVGLLFACEGKPPDADPTQTPEGRLCGRVYGSTIDSIEEHFNVRKVPLDQRPQMPEKRTYVEKCMEQGFSEAQLKCLDPKIAAVDETCAATLEPVAEKVASLNDVFREAREAAQGPGGEGDEAEGDEDATPAEGEEEGGQDAAEAVQDAIGG
jgi:hypothetical protein